MPDLKDANKKVRELVRTVLGMPENSVRPANQNAPTGTIDQQFATVLVMSVTPTGVDDESLVNEATPSLNVTESQVGQRLVVASIQFFRGDAINKASRLTALLKFSSSVAKMQAAGLGFVKASPVRNLSAVVDTYWEERAQLDISFHLISNESVSTPTFGVFPIAVDTTTSTSSHEVNAP